MRGSDQHLSSQEIQELAGFSADALPASLEDAMHHADSCDECRLRMLLSDELGLPSFSKTQSAPQPRTPACPPDSTWLQVAAGLESPDESRRQIQHASVCKRCGELLRVATEDLAVELSSEEEEKVAALASASPEWQSDRAQKIAGGSSVKSQTKKQPAARRHYLLTWQRLAWAVAGLAVVASAVWITRIRTKEPDVNQLLAQAYMEQRTIELRVLGAAPGFPRTERGMGRSHLNRPTALLEAESIISRRLNQHPDDPVWLGERGRAELLEGDYKSAIATLNRAKDLQNASSAIFVDLATAYFQRAEAEDHPADYKTAVDLLNIVLQHSPNEETALFNRAVVYGRLLLDEKAIDEWERYLDVPRDKAWDVEAHKYLEQLKQRSK